MTEKYFASPRYILSIILYLLGNITLLHVSLLRLLTDNIPGVDAQQYQRDWEFRVTNGVSEPWWAPTITDPYRRVVRIPGNTVWLEYNCYYMASICQNALKYLVSDGNRYRRNPTAFAYDFNGARRDWRRGRESCPGNWINSHSCPEIAGVPPGNLAQGLSYRYILGQGGSFWPLTAVEPGQVRTLQHQRDAKGNIIEMSRLYYTCDEWPAATFIQGGTGAFTRCAAFRCGPGSAGEQQFQGDSHDYLRRYLIDRADDEDLVLDRQNDVILFFFRTINKNNGVPARVISYDDNGVATEHDVPFEKRQNTNDMSYLEWMDWADSILMEDLIANYSGVQQFHILANRSEPTDLASMPILRRERWQSRLDDFEPLDKDIFLGPTRRSRRSLFGLTQPDNAEIDRQNTTLSDQDDKVHLLPERIKKEPSPSNINVKRHKLVRRDTLMSNDSDPTTTPLLKNSTQSDLEKAITIVEDAITESGRLNRARYANMARNHYGLKPGTVVGGMGRVRRRRQRARNHAISLDPRDDEGPSPLLDITPEIAAAAALVAEADAVGLIGSDGNLRLNQTVTQQQVPKNDGVSAVAGSFWMESLDRKGTVPWGDDPSYKVFRNVMEYGAKGDGVTDDSAAIQKAMSDGNRCGEKCNGSTLKNAIVYFPPGTYLVSRTIKLPFGTQAIGDANARPTILASSRFIGLGVLSTDEYTGGGKGPDGLDQEYYINTANFYRQIRNLIIDITATRSSQEVAGIHYQVAQATSTQNIDIIAKAGTSQRGMFSENGSGGQISDINFKNGNFCFYGGNQQFTAQRLNFDGCNTAVQVIWDWGWVWKSITVQNVDVGFRLVPEGNNEKTTKRKRDGEVNEAGNIGSASFIDSSFSNVGTAGIMIAPLDEAPGSGSTGVVLENVQFDNVGAGVKDTSGRTLLDGGSQLVEEWATGPIYSSGENRSYSMGGNAPKYRRETSLLDGSGKYFERAKPQYEGNSASDFVHLKDLGAQGDGTTDDTAAVQNALDSNVGKIIFVDAGTYILTGTVTIPSGSKLVGETWSQFAAFGPYFSDASNPKVMLKVGNVGDVGDVEMQDLLFTTKGPTPGAILVEWNIKARSPGSAALWDCHVRIGGATGSDLDPEKCPAVTSGTNSNCEGASLMMHITSRASGYFENMWLWIADHMIDDPLLDDANNNMEQTSIYVARGLLVESQSATWLYGTASEHAVYYQYSFNKVSNLFAGMLQTESPYYQPTPKPPSPFQGVVHKMNGDPDYACGGGDFDGCDSSWAVIMRDSQNIYVAGAGLYSWFSTYTQDCIDLWECQKALMLLENNRANVRLQHLITIGAKYSIVQDGKGILAQDNLNVDTHPSWSQISIFDVTPGDGRELHISPDDATVIPMPHSTVSPKLTFTIGDEAATDVVSLPYDGDQNDAPGPGRENCQTCSFFRLITSTCCGTGGSLGNPLVIPAGVPVPVPVQLPTGFIPNQDITGQDGVTYPKDEPLPAEVTIPVGTVFQDEPFVIPAGQPLANGEDRSDEGGFIWIDPEIWDEDDPTVWCNELPCTFQFPPWDRATSTIDYPIVTVVDDTFTTTITRPAITVSDWVLEPYIVTGVGPISPPTSTTTTTSSTTGGVIVVIWPPPPFDTTNTWPEVTYTGKDGKPTSTRPTTPTHPPPPPPGPPPPPPPPAGHWPSISITVSKGPPKPTVRPCAFPALQCPGSSPDPDGPGGPPPGPGDPEEPDEPEQGSCTAIEVPDPDPTDDPTSPPTSEPTPDPTPTLDHADTSLNEKTCYDSGQTSNNERMQNAAESFCGILRNSGPILGPGGILTWKAPFDGSPAMHIDLSFEVFDGCEWEYDYDECIRYMKVGIDSCDCSGADSKQGGYVTNNCVRARIDPQSGL